MYGKLFDSMFEGTLYGHWEAIVTLQQMIILCTPDGIVDMTPQHISGHTSIPLEIITKGLKILSEPDPYTRTPGEEGRRITLIDEHRPWGWLIVNHHKYKMMVDAEAKRQADKVRIAEKRLQNNDVAKCRKVSQSVADVAHTDSDSDSDSNTRTKALQVFSTGDVHNSKPLDISQHPKSVAVDELRNKLDQKTKSCGPDA